MDASKDETPAPKKNSKWANPPAIVAICISALSLSITLLLGISNTKVFNEWYFEPEVVVSDAPFLPIIVDTTIGDREFFRAIANFHIKNMGRSTATNIKLRIYSRKGSHMGVSSIAEASFVDTANMGGHYRITMIIPTLAPSEECSLHIINFSRPGQSLKIWPGSDSFNAYGALPEITDGRFDGGLVKILSGKRLPRYNPLAPGFGSGIIEGASL